LNPRTAFRRSAVFKTTAVALSKRVPACLRQSCVSQLTRRGSRRPPPSDWLTGLDRLVDDDVEAWSPGIDNTKMTPVRTESLRNLRKNRSQLRPSRVNVPRPLPSLENMSLELWVIVAIGALLALSLAIGLAVALVLARISEAAEALTMDPLAMALPRPGIAQAEEFALEGEVPASRNR
jgi:hypothetical protein